MKKVSLIFALVLSLGGWSAFAGSITSGFAKVKIENLQPGRTYKVSTFFQPIIVVNANDDPASMTMELVRPHEVDLDPGFEAIPTVEWASLAKDRFDVEAWGQAITELTLTIPQEKEFWGKKYELNIWTKATAGGNMGVGLMHKLLFSIAAQPNPDAKDEPKVINRFRLEPFEYHAVGLKFGRPIDLFKQSGGTMVLKNPNNRKCRFRIEVIEYAAAPIANLKNFAPAPMPHWLLVGEREFEVDGGKERQIPLAVNVPRNPNNRNKKWIFLVRATALDGDIPFSVISRVYITTSERLND